MHREHVGRLGKRILHAAVPRQDRKLLGDERTGCAATADAAGAARGEPKNQQCKRKITSHWIIPLGKARPRRHATCEPTGASYASPPELPLAGFGARHSLAKAPVGNRRNSGFMKRRDRRRSRALASAGTVTDLLHQLGDDERLGEHPYARTIKQRLPFEFPPVPDPTTPPRRCALRHSERSRDCAAPANGCTRSSPAATSAANSIKSWPATRDYREGSFTATSPTPVNASRPTSRRHRTEFARQRIPASCR